LPGVWQGWAVLGAFVVLLGAGALALPRIGPLAFVAYAMGLTVLLMLVCWLKGEPPRWRG
jgi:hypothetical protein